MIGDLLALLPYVVPVAGVAAALVFLCTPSTKPGTSTKPEGDDHRRNGRPQ